MPENQNNTPDRRIPARQAAERYLSHRREEVAQKTVQGQSTPVKRFANWCDNHNKSIHQLNGFDLQDFYDHLKEDGYKKVTLQNYMTAVRQFLRYLERLDVAPAGIADKVHLPSLQKGDRRRDEEIEPERVRETVQHLERFRYASRDHVILLILWRTGIRNGSLHSLDLQDFTELEDNGYVLQLRHRPDTDTPLKNGEDGERPVNLKQGTTQAIQAYIV